LRSQMVLRLPDWRPWAASEQVFPVLKDRMVR